MYSIIITFKIFSNINFYFVEILNDYFDLYIYIFIQRIQRCHTPNIKWPTVHNDLLDNRSAVDPGPHVRYRKVDYTFFKFVMPNLRFPVCRQLLRLFHEASRTITSTSGGAHLLCNIYKSQKAVELKAEREHADQDQNPKVHRHFNNTTRLNRREINGPHQQEHVQNNQRNICQKLAELGRQV